MTLDKIKAKWLREKTRVCIKNCNEHYQNWLEGEYEPREFNRYCRKEQEKLLKDISTAIDGVAEETLVEIKKEIGKFEKPGTFNNALDNGMINGRNYIRKKIYEFIELKNHKETKG